MATLQSMPLTVAALCSLPCRTEKQAPILPRQASAAVCASPYNQQTLLPTLPVVVCTKVVAIPGYLPSTLHDGCAQDAVNAPQCCCAVRIPTLSTTWNKPLPACLPNSRCITHTTGMLHGASELTHTSSAPHCLQQRMPYVLPVCWHADAGQVGGCTEAQRRA